MNKNITVSFFDYNKDPSKFWDKTREGYNVIVLLDNNKTMLLAAKVDIDLWDEFE